MSDSTSRPVRTRIAPSPTGNCHVGTARTALYDMLFARQHGGQFVLRIDDTDEKRSTIESEAGVLEGLRWLGLEWDEGPDVGGDYGPYRQSERLPLYTRYANQLLESGRAYPCFCTAEELAAEREAQREAGEAPRYSGKCRHLTPEERQARRDAGQEPVIRLLIDPKTMLLEDMVQGRVEQDAALIGDPVIVKSSGMPVYNFATVVDDYLMEMTHIFRGVEHLNNTFTQLQIYEALGWEPPRFAHLSLLLNPDRSKISKRTGAVYVGEFEAQGYLPEAMLNHLALSGWNPGTEEEVFDVDRLMNIFSMDRAVRSNAIFDRTKLEFLNGYYIRQLSLPELTRRVLPFLAAADLLPGENVDEATFGHLQSIMALVQERLKTLADAPDMLGFFFTDPQPETSIALLRTNNYAKKHTLPELRDALSRAQAALQTAPAWETQTLHDILDDLNSREIGWKRGQFLMPVRIVISGREATPSLFETMEAVGRETTLRRMAAVVDLLPEAEAAG